MNELRYCKTRKVNSPMRAYEETAGIDLYVPEDLELDVMLEKNPTLHACNFKFKANIVSEIILYSRDRVLIPSGLKFDIDRGYALIGYNKSGMSTKKGLDILANVVDSDYMGEVHLSVVNTSNDNQVIRANDKILQFIMIPIGLHKPLEISTVEELYANKNTNRGEGGFGSTQHK